MALLDFILVGAAFFAFIIWLVVCNIAKTNCLTVIPAREAQQQLRSGLMFAAICASPVILEPTRAVLAICLVIFIWAMLLLTWRLLRDFCVALLRVYFPRRRVFNARRKLIE